MTIIQDNDIDWHDEVDQRGMRSAYKIIVILVIAAVANGILSLWMFHIDKNFYVHIGIFIVVSFLARLMCPQGSFHIHCELYGGVYCPCHVAHKRQGASINLWHS